MGNAICLCNQPREQINSYLDLEFTSHDITPQVSKIQNSFRSFHAKTAMHEQAKINKEQFESKNQSAVKAGLNFNSINSLRLMVPPMDEQNAFVAFVKQTDKSKVVVQKALDEAQTLFDSLMQQYFG